MKLSTKLQQLRKKNGYSQEQLAQELHAARQTISKWENDQAIPELEHLIALSTLYKVSIDRIVKDDEICKTPIITAKDFNLQDMIPFLLEAKQQTYASSGSQVTSCRQGSHDYRYEVGDYMYYDTYLGDESFSGEEALWFQEKPIYSMNYIGRVLHQQFQSKILKEALSHVTAELPYRGPAILIIGDYRYHCKVHGDINWFYGIEEIYYLNELVYECQFHGGAIKE